jgi:hypothetical protein
MNAQTFISNLKNNILVVYYDCPSRELSKMGSAIFLAEEMMKLLAKMFIFQLLSYEKNLW